MLIIVNRLAKMLTPDTSQCRVSSVICNRLSLLTNPLKGGTPAREMAARKKSKARNGCLVTSPANGASLSLPCAARQPRLP